MNQRFFLANEVNYHLAPCFNFELFNIGASHQSNGFGGSLERSWNRFYLQGIFSFNNWMLDIKPWYPVNLSYNPDITNYMGYGQVVLSYKYYGNVFSLMARNVIESAGKRSGVELTWSFPINCYLKGYAQIFSGYGQSLIEYNHHTNSAGIGLALSDWV